MSLLVSNIQYLGSIVQDDCGSAIEVDSRICKTFKEFRFPCHILWYQRKIMTHTKLHILNAVVLPTLPYSLESLVLLEPQIHRLQGFVVCCLSFILGVSVREKKCYTSNQRMAKQQRLAPMLSQCRLLFFGNISGMDDSRLPKQLLVYDHIGGRRAAGGQKYCWNNFVLETWGEMCYLRTGVSVYRAGISGSKSSAVVCGVPHYWSWGGGEEMQGWEEEAERMEASGN